MCRKIQNVLAGVPVAFTQCICSIELVEKLVNPSPASAWCRMTRFKSTTGVVMCFSSRGCRWCGFSTLALVKPGRVVCLGQRWAGRWRRCTKNKSTNRSGGPNPQLQLKTESCWAGSDISFARRRTRASNPMANAERVACGASAMRVFLELCGAVGRFGAACAATDCHAQLVPSQAALRAKAPAMSVTHMSH